MKIFGCNAFVKISNSVKEKLELNRKKSIFLSCFEGTKVSRLMCSNTKKIIKSYDIEILEHKSASKKCKMCSSPHSCVFVITYLILTNKQDNEDKNSQNKDDGKDAIKEEHKHLNSCNI